MNNPVDPRKIPLFIQRLAKAGYLLDVECSKREIRITYKVYSEQNPRIGHF